MIIVPLLVVIAAAIIGLALSCLFRPRSSSSSPAPAPAPAPLLYYLINGKTFSFPAWQTTITYAQVLQALLGAAYNPAARPGISYTIGGIDGGLLVSGQSVKLVNAMSFRVS